MNSPLGTELSERALVNLMGLAEEHLHHAKRNLQDGDLFNCAEHIARAIYTAADAIAKTDERRLFVETCTIDPQVCRVCRAPNIDNEGIEGLCDNCSGQSEIGRGDG